MKENICENLTVVKRSGQRVDFNGAKIAVAIKSAFDDNKESEIKANKVYNCVLEYIEKNYKERKTINVEDIQDIIEETLKKHGYMDVYKSFSEYRKRRAASREFFSEKEKHKFVKVIEKINETAKSSDNSKPIDMLINFGKTISEEFSLAYSIDNKYKRAHDEGRIFINNVESYSLGLTSSAHLDFSEFNEKNIMDQTTKIILTLEHMKDEQFGEQTISDIDILYGNVIIREFKNRFFCNLKNILKIEGILDYIDEGKLKNLIDNEQSIKIEKKNFDSVLLNERIKTLFDEALESSLKEIERELEKNIERLITVIEDFHYRFSCNSIGISLGSSKTPESKLFIKIYFEVLNRFNNLKNVTTIYKFDKTDSEDLIERLQNKKNLRILFMNNVDYDDKLECFTNGLVINKNINDECNTSRGKILLSSSTINLARLGIKYDVKNMTPFYEELGELLDLCKSQLIQRYDIQANKYRENYDCMFENNIVFEAKKLECGQKVRKILRNGSLNIRFSGMGECLEALSKKDELDVKDFKLGLDIIKFMYDKIEKFTVENKLNFVLSEDDSAKTNRELLSLDKSMYGGLKILKKDRYDLLSKYLSKITSIKELCKIAGEYQKFASFDLKVRLPKNASKNKVEEVIRAAFLENVKTIKVEAGST